MWPENKDAAKSPEMSLPQGVQRARNGMGTARDGETFVP